MNVTEPKIESLVAEELAAANKVHDPFVSWHEAYAVMLEELDETSEELQRLDFTMSRFWTNIRANAADGALKCMAQTVKEEAVRVAAEAIQVAAMAQKAIDSLQKEKE